MRCPGEHLSAVRFAGGRRRPESQYGRGMVGCTPAARSGVSCFEERCSFVFTWAAAGITAGLGRARVFRNSCCRAVGSGRIRSECCRPERLCFPALLLYLCWFCRFRPGVVEAAWLLRVACCAGEAELSSALASCYVAHRRLLMMCRGTPVYGRGCVLGVVLRALVARGRFSGLCQSAKSESGSSASLLSTVCSGCAPCFYLGQLRARDWSIGNPACLFGSVLGGYGWASVRGWSQSSLTAGRVWFRRDLVVYLRETAPGAGQRDPPGFFSRGMGCFLAEVPSCARLSWSVFSRCLRQLAHFSCSMHASLPPCAVQMGASKGRISWVLRSVRPRACCMS
jgi:hypothetical protein